MTTLTLPFVISETGECHLNVLTRQDRLSTAVAFDLFPCPHLAPSSDMSVKKCLPEAIYLNQSDFYDSTISFAT